MPDISQVNIPNDNNSPYNLKDATARSRIESTTQENAIYHLGFYLDSNGGLCQVNSIGD